MQNLKILIELMSPIFMENPNSLQNRLDKYIPTRKAIILALALVLASPGVTEASGKNPEGRRDKKIQQENLRNEQREKISPFLKMLILAATKQGKIKSTQQ